MAHTALLFSSIALLLFSNLIQADEQPPNIVFVLFDDLGWNDVSFMGSQLPTPNIDALKSNGIEFTRHYIHLICSVSRSQFLTGRYAMYSGYGKMSPFGIGHIAGIPNGLPTFPQWLKAYNPSYTTYGIGKWHLGYATHSLTPKKKGFDHYFGPLSGAVKYDNAQIVANKCDGCNGDRYDLHDDGRDCPVKMMNTMYEYKHSILNYIDDEADTPQTPFYMFLPLQTPHGPLNFVRNYGDECEELTGDLEDDATRTHRIKYCENMLLSDDVIGDIIGKLKETNQWDNTLFVLTTDNGGDIENTGCNYPLRGTKGTLFEGNQRVITLVGGGVIPNSQKGTERESLVSALDWTPTLLDFAGILDEIAEEDRTWDGVNQYNLIMSGDDHVRDHVLFSIGLENLDSTTIVFKNPYDNNKLYKYLAQDVSIEKAGYMRMDGWCIPNEKGDWKILVNEDADPATQELDGKFLFNLIDDIGEYDNMLISKPDDVDKVVEYAISLIEPYMDHPLFTESIPGLWTYDSNEDRTEFGEEFIHPWMTQVEYLKMLHFYFDREAAHDHIIPSALKDMYTNLWVAPNAKSENFDERNWENFEEYDRKNFEEYNRENFVKINYNNSVGLKDMSDVNWNMYMFIGIGLMSVIAVVIKCISKRQFKYTSIQ